MPVTENRNRTIAFRVTEQEYKLLKRLSKEQRAHSVSDFARTMALMSANLRSTVPEIKSQAQSAEFRQSIEQQKQEIESIRRRVEELEAAALKFLGKLEEVK